MPTGSSCAAAHQLRWPVPPALQVAGAALLTTILETTSAEDLLAPGKGKQQWQQASGPCQGTCRP